MSRGGVTTIFIVTGILLLVGYITVYISTQNAIRNSDAAQSLGSTEEVQYISLSGEPVNIDDTEGRIRVVNSWASWSPYSKVELPALAQLAAEYHDEDVVVIAMNRGEDPVRAELFVAEIGDLSPLVVLIDPADSFYDRADGYSMPETLFYDKKGNLIKHVRGAMTIEKMRETVEYIINDNQ